ncbi:hypothetical protein WEN_02690 [Mycoplasma wenyonii str. Massachusetts]|uniref:Uncharacterized protein n=1 Tax=Mycoplasma wenyonii (strain Massachusetts) TaxID=1197325 RepID=I6Z6W1_MYCWM|nr:hypothetical protein [Mycoplasma wenyonii]AFN65323.1 hypothetical protein WEN_02690 [Mycoplasma wenyonii str. Massachusetts]
MSEENLRDKPWTYGQLFKNPKLAVVRLIGDVEDTAFNYLKRVAWPNAKSVQSLKEKNILPAIFALMTGGLDTGFDCSGGDSSLKGKYFKECEWNRNEWKVKKVLKTTFNSSGAYRFPEQGKGPRWSNQASLSSRDKNNILNMDQVTTTGLLDEKCEEEAWSDLIWDRSKKIRREVCDQIIRPWFGDLVQDKRLCLMEVEDYSYHLRMQTYLEVLQVPAWMNRNTFWTKCSNYGI